MKMRYKTWGFRLSILVGWSGGILGILSGIVLVTQPLYTQATSSASPPGNPIVPAEIAEAMTLSAGAIFAGAVVVLLVFGIPLALLTARQRGLFTAYSFGLLVLSLLALPSVGWVFLPATGLMAVAAVLAFIIGRPSTGSRPPPVGTPS